MTKLFEFAGVQPFLDNAQTRYEERMFENTNSSLLKAYPTVPSALRAIPGLKDDDFEEVLYCLQSALLEATEEYIVGDIVTESDHSYDGDVLISWGEPETYNGQPYVAMRIKSLTRIYVDYPLSSFLDKGEMKTILDEAYSNAMDYYNS